MASELLKDIDKKRLGELREQLLDFCCSYGDEWHCNECPFSTKNICPGNLLITTDTILNKNG